MALRAAPGRAIDSGLIANRCPVVRLPRTAVSFWRQWLAIPFRIVKILVRFHEIPDGEAILAVIDPRSASDDLLELDHRADWAHQYDMAHVAGIDPGREFVRRGEDGRDSLVVVLKIAQRLLAELAVIRRDALTVVWIRVGFELVDVIAHPQGVILTGAEHQGFLTRVDLAHELGHAAFFALLNDNPGIEIGLGVTPVGVDGAR